MKSENALKGADFVRAAACLSVVMHHIVQRLDPQILAPFWRQIHAHAMFGSYGVAAFFVLSGFLLAGPFWRAYGNGEPMPSLRQYALRRAARILPGFYLSLTITFILSFTLMGAVLDQNLVIRYLSGLLLVSDWHWLTLFPIEFNGPLWSIGFEITSYVFLPILFLIVFSSRSLGLGNWQARAVWLILILAVVYLHVFYVRTWPITGPGTGWQYGLVGGAREWMPEFNPFAFFAIFAMGALAAGLQTLWAKRTLWIFDLVGALGLVLCLYAVLVLPEGAPTEGYGILAIPYGFPLFPTGICLMLAGLPNSRILGTLSDNWPVRFIARISFGIYVWHYLVFELIRTFIDPDYLFAGIKNVGIWTMLSAFGIAISFAIATASFYWMEQPILNWARIQTRRPQLA